MDTLILVEKTIESRVSQADRVIHRLNDCAGKKFRLVDSNRKIIMDRLKEGYDVQDLLKVVEWKCGDDYFQDNPQYLNCETLFRPCNFARYLDEAESGTRRQGKQSTLRDDNLNAYNDVIRKMGR